MSVPAAGVGATTEVANGKPHMDVLFQRSSTPGALFRVRP
jgi:hypothetical protein